MSFQSYPKTRLRRTRQANWSRRLVAENILTTSDLIWPVFVHDNDDEGNVEISSMPDVYRYSLKSLPKIIKKATKLGIPAIAIFPNISNDKKNSKGTEATNPSNIVCQAIKVAKAESSNIGVICDVALDPFTDHGHDGLLDSTNENILNDETVDILIQQTIVQAKAGCDVIAPSDMMDGRIGLIREAFEKEGLINTQIMSYAAKYASGFYGPFRDAIGSVDLKGKDKVLEFRDKRGYQMDPANSNEALREVALDIYEGADRVMVKSGLSYLDVIYRISSEFKIPTYAYQVSGKYNMIKNAVDRGDLHEKVIFESLLALKRAGASGIFTYFAPFVAKKLSEYRE
ncbi:delta-aminolevulinic acid dehydratase [Francisella halioticida]|uniref:porphobilinogen synthase n=1 Tax=Francisella halioticida TaxID=549298 RepID=UPI001AFB0833|nr:porphobilinogen synthase [Francisella halioticida]BCD90382.1 delta-aminolevulinic acid dehydratase [Francisella halioticida]